MAAHWIYISSPRYRAFVEASKTNRLLFWGVTGGLSAAAGAVAYVVSGLTNPDYAAEGAKDQSDQVAKLSLQDQTVSRSQKQFIVNMLKDVQAGKDTERYAATLNGKLYGTTHGTTMVEPGALPGAQPAPEAKGGRPGQRQP